MAHQYSIDGDLGVVRLRASGEVTLAEWLSAMEEISKDGLFRPGMKFLSDATEVKLPPRMEENAHLAQRPDAVNVQRGAMAIVVASDAMFGAAAQYASFAQMKGQAPVRVFRDIVEAEVWLRLRSSEGKGQAVG